MSPLELIRSQTVRFDVRQAVIEQVQALIDRSQEDDELGMKAEANEKREMGRRLLEAVS